MASLNELFNQEKKTSNSSNLSTLFKNKKEEEEEEEEKEPFNSKDQSVYLVGFLFNKFLF